MGLSLSIQERASLASKPPCVNRDRFYQISTKGEVIYLPNYTSNIALLVSSSKTNRLISGFIERLQCQIPSDSRIKLVISEENKEFTGYLSIISGHLNFKIEFVENQMTDVLTLLTAKTKIQIKNWLKERLVAS